MEAHEEKLSGGEQKSRFGDEGKWLVKETGAQNRGRLGTKEQK